MDAKLLKLSRKLEERLLKMGKGKFGFTRKEFFRIVQADPTTWVDQGNVLVGGKYTNWFLKMYDGYKHQYNSRWINKFLREDIGKVTGYFKFHNQNIKRFPVNQRDINNIANITELYQIVESVRKIQTTSQLKKKALEHSIELATGNPNKRVFIPLTEEASIYLGMMTRWCTAATESENWFDHYFKQGFLYYVLIRKEDGAIEKFAFHFEKGEFMNELDQWIDDVHGFFKEHQEVANAIAEHRKSNQFNFTLHLT